MNITDYFSIGRPLDFSYKTNKAISGIILISLIIGIIVQYISDNSVTESFFRGFLFALTVFFTWAFAREIDPDNDYSAFIGVISVFSLLYLWQNINFIMIFWFILGVRILNRTTGLPARIFDVLILIVLSLILGYLVRPEFAMLSSVLLLIDFNFDKNQKFEIIFVIIGILGFIVSLLLFDNIWFSNPISPEYLWLSIIFISLFLITIVSTKELISKCDITKATIMTNRVKAAQLFVLFSLIIIFLLYGDVGFSNSYPIWCAIGGVGIYRIGKIIKNFKK